MRHYQFLKIVTFLLFLIFFKTAFATDLQDAISTAQANNSNIKLEKIKRITQRKMDRSKRTSNKDNFNIDGTIKNKGIKKSFG